MPRKGQKPFSGDFRIEGNRQYLQLSGSFRVFCPMLRQQILTTNLRDLQVIFGLLCPQYFDESPDGRVNAMVQKPI
jgi:hypothetical protein